MPKPRRGRWLRWRALRPPADDAVVGEDLNHKRVEYLSAAMADGMIVTVTIASISSRFRPGQLIECNSRIVCVENITEIAVPVGAVQL